MLPEFLPSKLDFHHKYLLSFHPTQVAYLYMGYGDKNNYVKNPGDDFLASEYDRR